jgi:hypothetical protein
MLSLLFFLSMASCFAFAAVVFGQEVQVAALPITVPTTTETLVVTGFAVTLPSDHGKAVVRGWLDLTVGAGTTDLEVNVYRGSAIGGPLVGHWHPQAGGFTPGSLTRMAIEFIDPISNAGGAQYCMSVLQTGATGDGIVVAALLDTTLLSG